MFYCEWCSLSETGLRPEAPRSSWHPDQRISSIQRRSRACQSHTHSLTPPTLVISLSLTNTFAFTHARLERAFFYLTLVQRGLFDSRLRIRFCVLLHSYSDWLMHLRESFLLQWSRTSPCNEGDFLLMTSYSLVCPHLKDFYGLFLVRHKIDHCSVLCCICLHKRSHICYLIHKADGCKNVAWFEVILFYPSILK